MTNQSDISRLIAEENIAHGYRSYRRTVNDEALLDELERNDYLEIGVVTDGSGILCIEGQVVPCASGDVYLIPPNVPHGYFLTDDDGSLSVRMIGFCVRDWFKGDVAAEDNARYCFGVFRDGATVACAMLNSDMRRRVGAILDDVEEELKEKHDEWRSVVSSEIVRLLCLVGRYINSSDKLPCRKNGEAELTSAVMRIVAEEFENCKLSLESIATRLFVSPSVLSRSFKANSGRLFSEYLRHMRLNYAAKLLRESNVGVEAIVERCGFRDMTSFYRNFRQTFGMTPNAYKQFTATEVKKQNNNDNDKRKAEIKMQILSEISTQVQNGKAKIVKELVQNAIDAGVPATDILNCGLLAGMNAIGEKFKNNEVYVPEVLVAARAMSLGSQILKPYLADIGVTAKGRVCIGTVLGDLHDIGKNLVKMMMEGKGLEVIDLGTDVAPEVFVRTAIEQDCQVICCSALLTTTMPVMEDVVKAAEEAGIRDRVKIMVGGAPVSEEFRSKIGADNYSVDAASAAEAAVELCKR